MRKKLQVFISSTYKDLIEERQAAVEAILKAGHIPVGMELFTAGDKSQLEIIKRWIDDSDVFLLILGGRYGSVESESELSYIELEYEYAVKKNIPVFALVINDELLNKKVSEIGRKVLELENPDKYKRFKEKVLGKMCDFFNDKKDIKLAVSNTLSRFEKRFDFTGWVSGENIKTNQELEEENKRLRKQLEKKKSEIKELKERLENSNSNENQEKDSVEEQLCVVKGENGEPILTEVPYIFFYHRMADAFPGVRNLKYFNNPKTAIKRLQILLKYPLQFKDNISNTSDMKDPIWYWRGSSCLDINSFKKLNETKCLINQKELEINRIAVYRGSDYYRNFVYVETKAEDSLGPGKEYTDKEIEYLENSLGYIYEEYGLLGENYISRQEFDDSVAVIDDEVVDAQDAELRVRYLSEYNFFIAPKDSPMNSQKGDQIGGKYLNGILQGTYDLDDFLDEFLKLPKK
ncbi:DUF4062 domain-containing protein [Selenihalanaerobacter shriftii]|uniref:DUF4062 domain-containing protein n=1 Tax=Selenihalanaerobacter shriftii TaxID=142842 RepID=A0A1T4LL34_9FIRM|nr:DUF4062 domain-containing protein [Selenihalanaerobacter shriftii]SJZ55429.1 protein of unknown function [Selenihalanaerobacter shriftii]